LDCNIYTPCGPAKIQNIYIEKEKKKSNHLLFYRFFFFHYGSENILTPMIYIDKLREFPKIEILGKVEKW
jgi:hypothetical protein